MVLRAYFIVPCLYPRSTILKRRRSPSINYFRLHDRTTKSIAARNKTLSRHNRGRKLALDLSQLARGENPRGRERRTLQVSRQFPSPIGGRTICFTYRLYLFVDREVAVMLVGGRMQGGSMSCANYDFMGTRIRG